MNKQFKNVENNLTDVLTSAAVEAPTNATTSPRGYRAEEHAELVALISHPLLK